MHKRFPGATCETVKLWSSGDDLRQMGRKLLCNSRPSPASERHNEMGLKAWSPWWLSPQRG